MKNLPNILTILRIILIPIILLLIVLDTNNTNFLALAGFIIASLSDYLDGYLARKYNFTSNFGTMLDPIADKLLVVVTILLLSRTFNSMLFLVPSLIIISREFLVIAIRQRLAEIKVTIPLRVNTLGKIKTAFQMISLFLLLLHPNILFSFINLHIMKNR